MTPLSPTPDTLPLMMFMRGEPRKPATKRLRGLSNRSSGVPTCSTRPARSTTILSASVIASTWSCVT